MFACAVCAWAKARECRQILTPFCDNFLMCVASAPRAECESLRQQLPALLQSIDANLLFEAFDAGLFGSTERSDEQHNGGAAARASPLAQGGQPLPSDSHLTSSSRLQRVESNGLGLASSAALR
jgi:hypothetical protein